MRYIIDDDLDFFDAWSGGKRNLKELAHHPKAYEYIESFIEDWTYDSINNANPLSATDINDFLWFDMYDFLEEAHFVNENHEWIDGEDEDDD